jgi:4-hydroxy-3-polyprenylbenzoate decarboxylase
MRRYVLGITGASGGVYALKAATTILESGAELHMVISREGLGVLKFETGVTGESFSSSLAEEVRSRLYLYRYDESFARIASGSFKTDGMLILPCSMSSVAAIANGTGGDLLRRAADVHLKERRHLVVVPRETPLSTIHLRNLLLLAEAGAVVLPACPGFYAKPTSLEDVVDFVVGRSLDALGVESGLAPRWEGK